MICAGCGKPFTPGVHNKRYCSEQCRGKSYRQANPDRAYAVKKRERALLLGGTQEWLDRLARRKA